MRRFNWRRIARSWATAFGVGLAAGFVYGFLLGSDLDPDPEFDARLRDGAFG